ncbi:YfcZ/YiiS family protein [Rodentibacter caecimuris]|uniref:DUF406 domain-containing protein n=1 Tax=Rodentibacter caecimuris TaxID=1796644 RepID=A0ABX3KW40_9PAST|nr:hypothetical protein BKG89_07480 [Rodentibacter heylii]
MSSKNSTKETDFDVGVIVGSVIDGSDCTVNIDKVYPTQAEAENALSQLTEKARKTESEPCQIESQIKQTEKGIQLSATFIFSCQAEAMIFELSNR